MLSPDFFQRSFVRSGRGFAFRRVLYTALGSAAAGVLLFGAAPHVASAQEDPSVMNLLPDEAEGGAPAAPAPAPAAAAPVPQEVEDEIAAPSANDLQSPPAEPVVGAIEVPSIEAPAEIDDNVFFDAEALVPSGEMGSSTPRKVNPRLQPASKLIVVTKEAGPDSRKAQLVAASRAVKLGRYEAALDMYDQLYAKNKRDPRILMGRAVSLQHLGRFDAAIGTYEELADVDPHNVEAKINMLGLLGTKYPSVALRRLLDLRDEHANNPGIAAQIAVIQAKLGDFEGAIRYLGIAASMEPNNASHIYNMAVIADRAGSKSQAIKYYEQALELDSIYGRGGSIPRESVYERLANIR